MKTVILTINTREAYGDKAVATTVGVYQFEVPKLFNWAVTRATELMQKRGHIAPKERARVMRKILARRGFKALRMKECFVAVF